MWFGIGYLVPQKGDRSGGGVPPIQYYLIAESEGVTTLQAESGALLTRESAP
tara:strand:+ start:237 stop:392 length:156 start_codon:yes stop_codon:yes gene_type:complete